MSELENCWFEELFDNIDHSIWILDPQGIVLKANPVAQELMNFAQEKVVGLPLWSVAWQGLSRPNRHILKWVVNQAMLENSAARDLEFQRRGQTVRIINISCKPILHEGGEHNFILVEGHDITGYKQTSKAALIK